MKIILVAAITMTGGFAYESKTPWNDSDEFSLFQSIIKGKTILLGRKTYESIPKKSPGKTYLVVTSKKIPDVRTFTSLEQALAHARTITSELYVVGGKSIYDHTIKHADMLYLSFMKKEYKTDTFFPSWKGWQLEKIEEHRTFDFCVFKRPSL